MTGKWIKRRVDEHQCDLPRYDKDIQRCDQWKCECGRIWIVSSIWRGDQREPLSPGEDPHIRWMLEF